MVLDEGTLQSVGPYRVLRVLGRGGMGVVYLAEDERLCRRVAIKTVVRGGGLEERHLARLRREARLLAQLNHPNIAQVHDLLERGGELYIVLEFVEGRRLDEVIDEGLDLPRALAILDQVLCALEAAHERGMIHRDLKPQNVHVTPEGCAKVLDFGLARPLRQRRNGKAGDAVTRPGAAAGTPGYMSPEQCRGEHLDERTDIWAFGCIAFECLAGAAAFEGDGESARISRTVQGSPAWELLPADVPLGVVRLLERCLAKEAARRPGSCREVREELRRAMDEAEASVLKGNLRPDLTTFVGREGLFDEVQRLVSRNRLVTLTGPGGCGKSRLARRIAIELWPTFREGAWFVELAPLRRHVDVERTVLATLEPGEARGLDNALGHRRVLVVLDNCEHLLRPCRELVGRILHTSDRVHVLAISREAIGLFGEQIVPVPPLALGTPGGQEPSEAARLFLERARLAAPRFNPASDELRQIERICARLDGIPLAVELAAACVRAVPVEELSRRLDGGLDAVAGRGSGRPAHQQTLERAIAWSDDLLAPAERALLRRLSVFRGGWTFEACGAVCAEAPSRRFSLRPARSIAQEDLTSLLVKLVDKSLVVFDRERRRYRMLETIRRYAEDHLDRRLRQDLLDRHMRFFLEKAERAAEGLHGRGRADWLDRLDGDIDNLRQAIATAREVAPELELRLGIALGTFWSIRGHAAEGLEVIQNALAQNERASIALRAEAEHAAGMLAWRSGRLDEASGHYLRSLRLWRKSGDEKRQPSAVANLGLVCNEKRDVRRASRMLARAAGWFDRLGDQTAAAQAKLNLAVVLLEQDRLDEAETLLEACRRVFHDRDDEQREAVALTNLGEVQVRAGRAELAIEPLERARALRAALGDGRGLVRVLVWLAAARLAGGDADEAATLLAREGRLRREAGFGLDPRDEQIRRSVTERLAAREGAEAANGAGESRE